MVHALATQPRLQLDAKRIIGTTVAIAVHVAALMMLLMPMQQPQSSVMETEDPPYIPVPEIKIRPIVEVPKEKTIESPPQLIAPKAKAAPDDPPVDPIDDPTAVNSTPYVEKIDVAPTDFGDISTGTAFVQLATISAPAPPYPRPAITRRMTGTVTLRIHVDASGQPIEVTIENSSGHALLDEVAMKFVKARWRFVPATSGGVASDAWALVPIQFVLN